MIQIHELYLYPVKSLRGFQLSDAQLTPLGLAYDRFWMVIDENNRFVTQRKIASMVLIHTSFSHGRLTLSKPCDTSLSPLVIGSEAIPDSATFDATIWKDTCQVIDEGNAASEWITQAIGSESPLRLVRMAQQPRPQSKPDLLGENTSTLFADAAPFLVTNTASLDAVNQALSDAKYDKVTMERFRPNIVLKGIDAFAEHKVAHLLHQNYQFSHCYPCQRCIMPTINPDNAERHPQQQPFSLIAELNAMPDNSKAPAFGENAILSRGEGSTIRVGDVLDIRTRI